MVQTDTEISFAGESYTLLPNALKVTIFTSNWPFLALANSLEFIMNFSVPQQDVSSLPLSPSRHMNVTNFFYRPIVLLSPKKMTTAVRTK